MQTLSNKGFYRIWHIIGDPTAEPPIPPLLPVGKSTFWAGVKSGKFPQPVKLGARTTAWRVSDIQALLESMGAVQPVKLEDNFAKAVQPLNNKLDKRATTQHVPKIQKSTESMEVARWASKQNTKSSM
jgi:predicted DNA-binding transcriptional regulator AlpA